jgi:HTH-type transcriptional regulator, global nitrogen regulator NrpRI
MAFITPNVERKTFSILQVLANTSRPLGSIVIARELKDLGVDLGERAVRYHLQLTDEHGLTRLAGRRDGREITPLGIKELRQGMVKEKIGFALSRIESLAFRTTFDVDKLTGLVPVNVSFIRKKDYQKALSIMRPVFSAGWCASTLVAEVQSGDKLGELTVPDGVTALATVCSVVVNGALLKAGIPLNSKFGGLLQLQDGQPWRFVDVIHYSGCSLDPAEVFIRAGMTSVTQAVKSGNGSILANFRDMPSLCRPTAQDVITKLAGARLNAVSLCGSSSEHVCEIPLEFNRVGMILTGGLNPVAAAEEAGVRMESHAMSTLIDYKKLVDFDSLLK